MHSVVPVPTARLAGGLSIPCWLSIPPTRIPAGSGRAGPALAPREQPAVVEPSSSPSIILIRRRWQPGAPWQRGCADGRDRRQHRADKHSQTKTTTPLLGTSKRRADIYVVTDPAWVLGAAQGGDTGRNWGGDRALPARSCGADRGNVKGCGQGAKQLTLHCDGHRGIKTAAQPRQGSAPWALCAYRLPNHPIEMYSK